MGVGRLLLLMGISLGLIVLMIALGHRDLVLVLGSHTVEGRITNVQQPPPGAVRASDFNVWYEFDDDAGETRAGQDLLPPAKPPPSNGSVMIAYSFRDSSVSRIASQVSYTPVCGVLFGGVMLVWSMAQLVLIRLRPAGGPTRRST